MNLRISKALPLFLSLFAVVCVKAGSASTDCPWESAPFSATAADIASAAKRIPDTKGPGVVMLLQEVHLIIDASNRITETHHLVYRVGAQSPGNWSAVAAVWQPWRQQKPSVRARVITSDAREIQFDPNTLSESPLNSLGIDTFGDGRLIRGPLPALATGAVVEIETSVRDTHSVFNAGLASAIPFGDLIPILHSMLTIETPEAVPLRFRVQQLPNAKTSNEVAGGKRIVTIDNDRMDALDPEQLLSLSGDNKHPRVVFSTAASWKEVAVSYSQIVDRVVSQSSLNAVAKDMAGTAGTREEKLERILQQVQHSIRYSAVQLGEAAVVPTSPNDTLKLEYGDCKDQATLIIALLRSAGIDAYLALLEAGPSPDIEADLPGFGAFDHAIVYVPGPNPVWMDSTTRFSRVGQLPQEDQGRLALIVKPDTTELVRTPEFVSRIVENQQMLLADQGRGRIVTTRLFYGSDEIGLRTLNNELQSADMQKTLEQFAKETYSAKSLRGLERSNPEDFSAPYRMHYEMEDSGYTVTTGGEAAAFISLESTFDQIGIGAFTNIENKFAADGVDLLQRTAREWNYRIVPPSGYVVAETPPTRNVRLGPATFSQEFKAASDGSVRGSILFDSGKRKFTYAEFADFKKAVAKLTDDTDEMLTISFELQAKRSFDSGNIRAGIAEYRQLIAAHPEKAIYHSQFALALLQHGMGELSRAEARLGVQLEPASAAAHDSLGRILEYSLVGERFKPGFELEQAQSEFRRAVELDPESDDFRGNLATALEYNTKGERYGKGVDLQSAIDQYRQFHSKPDSNSDFYRNLPFDLMLVGDFAGIKEMSSPPDLRIAAIAAIDGVSAALREAGKMALENRNKVLTDAANWLAMNRKNPEAAGLMKAANSVSAFSYEAVGKDEDTAMDHGTRVAEDMDDQLLWLAQYRTVTSEDLSHAEKNVVNSRGRNAVLLRTLAALKAETGNPEEALQVMKTVFTLKSEGFQPDDWYIFGRIYEQFGEWDSAVSAYRKVPSPNAAEPNVKSAYPLAQRRLAVHSQ